MGECGIVRQCVWKIHSCDIMNDCRLLDFYFGFYASIHSFIFNHQYIFESSTALVRFSQLFYTRPSFRLATIRIGSNKMPMRSNCAAFWTKMPRSVLQLNKTGNFLLCDLFSFKTVGMTFSWNLFLWHILLKSRVSVSVSVIQNTSYAGEIYFLDLAWDLLFVSTTFPESNDKWQLKVISTCG